MQVFHKPKANYKFATPKKLQQQQQIGLVLNLQVLKGSQHFLRVILTMYETQLNQQLPFQWFPYKGKKDLGLADLTYRSIEVCNQTIRCHN